jgi:hypothetical protein
VRDPFGNIWWLQSHASDVPEQELQARMHDPAMVEAMRYATVTGRRAPQQGQPAGLKPRDPATGSRISGRRARALTWATGDSNPETCGSRVWSRSGGQALDGL